MNISLMLHDAFQSLAFTILADQERGWQMALTVWFAFSLFFSLIIDFISLSPFFTTYLNDIRHRTINCVLTLQRLGKQMGLLNDLLTFLSDTDHTSTYLLMEDVEQMSCLLKRIVDCFFSQHIHLEIWKRKSFKCKQKGDGIWIELYLKE